MLFIFLKSHKVYFCHFIFLWWPAYGKWQRIRLRSCLKQPETRLCAGSHAGFLLFLGCAGRGILLTLREEYLFSSIPMESFSICSAAHQRSSFFKWLSAGNLFQLRHWLKQRPFCWAASRVGFMTENRMCTSILFLLLSSLGELCWLVRMLSQKLLMRLAIAWLCILAVVAPL